MKRFAFDAYDGTGRRHRGTIEADSAGSALDALRGRGLFPVVLDATEGPAPIARATARRIDGSGGALPSSGMALIARELATLLKAGLPLDEALEVVSLRPSLSRRIRQALEAVLGDVRSGASLSEAMAARAGAFPDAFWRLVHAGEIGGTVPQVLDDLATFLDQENRLRSQLATALVYPSVLLAVALATLLLVVTVMVPAIMPLFGDAGVEAPMLLSALAAVSAWTAATWPLLLGLAVAAVAALVAARSSPVWSAARDRAVLAVPVVGTLARHASTARFARTLSTLLRNAVPMQEALTVTAGAMANEAFRQALVAAERDVSQGRTLRASLSASGLFPDLSLRLVALGEQSGQLAAMLGRTAEVYEQDLQQSLQRLLALAVPAITVTIGGLVGGLMLSVMGAMLSLNETVLK